MAANPGLVCMLAKDVYAINSELEYEFFRKNTKELDQNFSRIEAQVGSRLINAEDNFAVWSYGTGD